MATSPKWLECAVCLALFFISLCAGSASAFVDSMTADSDPSSCACGAGAYFNLHVDDGGSNFTKSCNLLGSHYDVSRPQPDTGRCTAGECCALRSMVTINRSRRDAPRLEMEVPIGKHAAERWGCRDCDDPRCHPDLCVTGAPVFEWDVPESFDKALRPPSATTRFAVCFAGQIRAGRHSFLLENLKTRLLDPLDADVFVEVSSEERDVHYHSVSKAEAFYFQHSLDPVHMRLATDAEMRDEMIGEVDSERRRGAIGARWRSCLRRIKDAETKRGARYEYVLRLRPDAAFPCIVAPPEAWPEITTQRSLLFKTNEAFLATRPAAEFALNLTVPSTILEKKHDTEATPGFLWWLHRHRVHFKPFSRPEAPSMILSCTTTFCTHRAIEVHLSSAKTCERPCFPRMDDDCASSE